MIWRELRNKWREKHLTKHCLIVGNGWQQKDVKVKAMKRESRDTVRMKDEKYSSLDMNKQNVSSFTTFDNGDP